MKSIKSTIYYQIPAFLRCPIFEKPGSAGNFFVSPAVLAWRRSVWKISGAPKLDAVLSFSLWPSGYVKITIENGTFTVDLPIQDGDFL